MAAARKLVVAIHDVTPSLAADVHYLLDACDAMGVRPLVLKVIPNEDGRNDIREHPEFARMLVREASIGSEIVLHGYTHQAAGPIRGLGAQQIRGRLFAPTAAEFLTLDRRRMHERLQAGLRILRDAGLDPHGFCAPGWLATADLPRQLRDCGLRYYLTMSGVHDVVDGHRISTPWMGYMGVEPLQERLVRLGADVLAPMARTAPVRKVFLHPQGARESAACSYVLQQLPRLIENRRIVSYESLLAPRS